MANESAELALDRDKLVVEREKLKLDRERLTQDRDKAAYDQNFAQFRNLNDHLHRLPTLLTTLTGGLWFAAGLQERLSEETRFALLYLAGWFGLMLIIVMLRLRDVMQSYLDKIEEFNRPMFANSRPKKPLFGGVFGNYSMVILFALMGLLTVVLSWVGAFALFWPGSWASWFKCGVAATIALVALLFCWIVLMWFVFSKSDKSEKPPI